MNNLLPAPESPEWFAAMAVRYHASFHIAPLPSGKLAVFFDRWQLVAVGTAEEIAGYFHNPPALREQPRIHSRPAFADAEELLASLNF